MANKKRMFKKVLSLGFILGMALALVFFISGTSAQTSCPSNTTPGETQATLVGEITDDGGDSNLTVWFQYGLTTSYGSESSRFLRQGSGVFCATVYNLTPCTLYHYRAVAQNSSGTSYGENKTFTTLCTPTVDIKTNNSDGLITVNYRSYVTLSWNSTRTSSCTASGDWSGSKPVSGSETIQMNQVKTYTFTLACTASTGNKTVTDSVTVNVKANLPIVITKPAVITY